MMYLDILLSVSRFKDDGDLTPFPKVCYTLGRIRHVYSFSEYLSTASTERGRINAARQEIHVKSAELRRTLLWFFIFTSFALNDGRKMTVILAGTPLSARSEAFPWSQMFPLKPACMALTCMDFEVRVLCKHDFVRNQPFLPLPLASSFLCISFSREFCCVPS